MQKRYQVFVSSTFEDLKEERQKVIEALLKLRCLPAVMEFFVASDDSQWDLIAVDGFDSNARAGALAGLAFYAACRRRLTADGLLVVNMFGELRGFKTQLQRLNKAFDGRVLALPPCPSGNVVAFATAGEVVEVPAELLQERATALEAGTGLKLGPSLKRLKKSGLLAEGVLRF